MKFKDLIYRRKRKTIDHSKVACFCDIGIDGELERVEAYYDAYGDMDKNLIFQYDLGRNVGGEYIANPESGSMDVNCYDLWYKDWCDFLHNNNVESVCSSPNSPLTTIFNNSSEVKFPEFDLFLSAGLLYRYLVSIGWVLDAERGLLKLSPLSNNFSSLTRIANGFMNNVATIKDVFKFQVIDNDFVNYHNSNDTAFFIIGRNGRKSMIGLDFRENYLQDIYSDYKYTNASQDLPSPKTIRNSDPTNGFFNGQRSDDHEVNGVYGNNYDNLNVGDTVQNPNVFELTGDISFKTGTFYVVKKLSSGEAIVQDEVSYLLNESVGGRPSGPQPHSSRKDIITSYGSAENNYLDLLPEEIKTLEGDKWMRTSAINVTEDRDGNRVIGYKDTDLNSTVSSRVPFGTTFTHLNQSIHVDLADLPNFKYDLPFWRIGFPDHNLTGQKDVFRGGRMTNQDDGPITVSEIQSMVAGSKTGQALSHSEMLNQPCIFSAINRLLNSGFSYDFVTTSHQQFTQLGFTDLRFGYSKLSSTDTSIEQVNFYLPNNDDYFPEPVNRFKTDTYSRTSGGINLLANPKIKFTIETKGPTSAFPNFVDDGKGVSVSENVSARDNREGINIVDGIYPENIDPSKTESSNLYRNTGEDHSFEFNGITYNVPGCNAYGLTESGNKRGFTFWNAHNGNTFPMPVYFNHDMVTKNVSTGRYLNPNLNSKSFYATDESDSHAIYRPLPGAVEIRPTSFGHRLTTDFIRKGGSAAIAAVYEPGGGGANFGGSITSLLLRGYTVAEAFLFFEGIRNTGSLVMGDGLAQPFASMAESGGVITLRDKYTKSTPTQLFDAIYPLGRQESIRTVNTGTAPGWGVEVQTGFIGIEERVPVSGNLSLNPLSTIPYFNSDPNLNVYGALINETTGEFSNPTVSGLLTEIYGSLDNLPTATTVIENQLKDNGRPFDFILNPVEGSHDLRDNNIYEGGGIKEESFFQQEDSLASILKIDTSTQEFNDQLINNERTSEFIVVLDKDQFWTGGSLNYITDKEFGYDSDFLGIELVPKEDFFSDYNAVIKREENQDPFEREGRLSPFSNYDFDVNENGAYTKGIASDVDHPNSTTFGTLTIEEQRKWQGWISNTSITNTNNMSNNNGLSRITTTVDSDFFIGNTLSCDHKNHRIKLAAGSYLVYLRFKVNTVGLDPRLLNLSLTFQTAESTVNISDNVITSPNHGLKTNDEVIYSDGGGTAISGTGISDQAKLFVIRKNSDVFSLASSSANAKNGVSIDITSGGEGNEMVLNFVDPIQHQIFEVTFPVGSIYTNADKSDSPNKYLLGGKHSEWETYSPGRIIVGDGSVEGDSGLFGNFFVNSEIKLDDGASDLDTDILRLEDGTSSSSGTFGDKVLYEHDAANSNTNEGGKMFSRIDLLNLPEHQHVGALTENASGGGTLGSNFGIATSSFITHNTMLGSNDTDVDNEFTLTSKALYLTPTTGTGRATRGVLQVEHDDSALKHNNLMPYTVAYMWRRIK